MPWHSLSRELEVLKTMHGAMSSLSWWRATSPWLGFELGGF